MDTRRPRRARENSRGDDASRVVFEILYAETFSRSQRFRVPVKSELDSFFSNTIHSNLSKIPKTKTKQT